MAGPRARGTGAPRDPPHARCGAGPAEQLNPRDGRPAAPSLTSKPAAAAAGPYNRIQMVVRPRLVLVITAIVAFVVFAIVQDRVTAAGARRYVALQRDAIAGRGQAVTVDEIMRPAVERSVQQGLMWGGAVLVAGASVAGVVARRQKP